MNKPEAHDRGTAAMAAVTPEAMFGDAVPVYLAPHSDDICFSLGALAVRRTGGWLVSEFTKSDHSLTPPAGSVPDTTAITERRAQEDIAFAHACNLLRLDLGLTEPRLPGRGPWDLSFVEADRSALRKPLFAALDRIVAEASGRKLALVCPSGIGGHVNHAATLLTIVEALPRLRQVFRVFFYEDLPYAFDDKRRKAGLSVLFRLMGAARRTRFAVGFDESAGRKLELIRLYRSQFVDLPGDCEEFSPAVGGFGLHEALWEFTPD